MKGISHFISGVAAATFVSKAVNMAMYDSSIIIALGGLFGILPDTLDFKFAKFMQKFDFEVDPHPDDMNPQIMADIVAQAINTAFKEKKEISLMLHSVKISADLFRQYSVYFDNEQSQVVVEIGPIVNMSKIPYPGTEYQGNNIGKAKLDAKVLHSYDDKTYIDIFSGSDFSFRKSGDKVEALFIPWHRRWSHSLTLGIFFGIAGWLLLKLFGVMNAHVYGFVFSLGFCTHVLEDQLGYMGSNLFWPFTKERMNGLHWMRSGDALPNFTTVWISCLIILFNLNRFAPEANKAFHMSWVEFAGYTFFIPLVLLLIVGKIFDTISMYKKMKDDKYREMLISEMNKESRMESEESIS
ncbi:MAG: metal-dependent hydrolase [Candidatus Muirbacterium halophilum]|nr:metal-dependent hydrolase [Candidatus Muirbacterium halophilum]MCK9475349.1 metal-dependent hydrolase [Candidatus Muirbacterium halophilum]